MQSSSLAVHLTKPSFFREYLMVLFQLTGVLVALRELYKKNQPEIFDNLQQTGPALQPNVWVTEIFARVYVWHILIMNIKDVLKIAWWILVWSDGCVTSECYFRKDHFQTWQNLKMIFSRVRCIQIKVKCFTWRNDISKGFMLNASMPVKKCGAQSSPVTNRFINVSVRIQLSPLPPALLPHH